MAVPPAEDFMLRFLPIISNLMFLFAASRALDYGYGVKAWFIALIAVFTSPLFHICVGYPYACLWSFYKHRVIDYWSAELTMIIIGLIFIKFRKPYLEMWIILTLLIVIGLLVTGTDSNFVGQALIGGIIVLVIVLYIFWHKLAHGYWPPYDWTQVIMGITFSVFGVAFFIVQDWWPPYYGYLHSYWHAFIAIGGYFFVGIRDPEPQYLNLASDINNVEEQLETSGGGSNIANAIGTSLNRGVEFLLPVVVPKWKREEIRKKRIFSGKGIIGSEHQYQDNSIIAGGIFSPMARVNYVLSSGNNNGGGGGCDNKNS